MMLLKEEEKRQPAQKRPKSDQFVQLIGQRKDLLAFFGTLWPMVVNQNEDKLAVPQFYYNTLQFRVENGQFKIDRYIGQSSFSTFCMCTN